MTNQAIQSIAVGDRYESEGRTLTIWKVDTIISIPRSESMVRIAQVDGIAKVTLKISQLGYAHGFRRVDSTAPPK